MNYLLSNFLRKILQKSPLLTYLFRTINCILACSQTFTYFYFYANQAEIYYLCKMNNYPLPTVYQGMYNPVTRWVQTCKVIYKILNCKKRASSIQWWGKWPLSIGLPSALPTLNQLPPQGGVEGRHSEKNWVGCVVQNPYFIYGQNLRFFVPYLWPDQKFDTLFMTWP